MLTELVVLVMLPVPVLMVTVLLVPFEIGVVLRSVVPLVPVLAVPFEMAPPALVVPVPVVPLLPVLAIPFEMAPPALVVPVPVLPLVPEPVPELPEDQFKIGRWNAEISYQVAPGGIITAIRVGRLDQDGIAALPAGIRKNGPVSLKRLADLNPILVKA
jgi:hypothetical protein